MINVSNDISYRLANDSRLENVTNRQYESVYDVVKAYKDYPDIKDYIRLYKEISGIRSYINNKTLLNNWEFLQPSAAVLQSDWYKQAERSNGLIGWNYIEDERDHHKYLSLIRKIDFVNHHNKGILVINVNSRLLNSILNQETFETMIVDANNHIISANRPDRIGKTLAEINFDPGVIKQQSGSFEAVVDGKPSQIQIEALLPDSSVNGIRIISVFSIQSIVMNANQIIKLALIVITISFIVAFILIYGFSSLLTKRMSSIKQAYYEGSYRQFGYCACYRWQGRNRTAF